MVNIAGLSVKLAVRSVFLPESAYDFLIYRNRRSKAALEIFVRLVWIVGRGAYQAIKEKIGKVLLYNRL
ncbi:hypothetical protein J2X69_003348 [Algoriphagus sp. 4150]|nr:hypothetical protein [Algoriphagus sp. 4150]